jgi:precorrin-4/cobalt-precorrin-4 C11-methyltransferase
MTRGRVVFVGCGPGAPDLLTLRAADAIAAADVVIWGSSLLAREAVDRHSRAGAEIIEWPPATMRDVLAAYDRARDEGLVVARLKSGDPAVFGVMADELAAVLERGVEVEVVPGVSALGAAAALLGWELTAAGGVAVVRPGEPARAAVVFMAGTDPAGTQAELAEQGIGADDPCAIVHRVSWPGEVVVRCRAGEVAEQLADLGLDGLTIVLAGPAAIDPKAG